LHYVIYLKYVGIYISPHTEPSFRFSMDYSSYP